MLRGAIAVTVLLALQAPGCGVDSPSAGVNAPCTRDKDCHAELACVRGVCADPNAPDAGDAAAAATDAADAAAEAAPADAAGD